MTNIKNPQDLCQQSEDFQKCFIALYLSTRIAVTGIDRETNGWSEEVPGIGKAQFEILATLSRYAAQLAVPHIAFSGLYVENAIKIVDRFIEDPNWELDCSDEIKPSEVVEQLYSAIDDISELEARND